MSDLKRQWEKTEYATDIGQKAKVERGEMSGDLVDQANETLLKIGVALGQGDPASKHLTYLGSAAVHIFGSYNILAKNGTPQLGFYCQTSTLGTMNELVAASAGQDLLKAIAARYGRKPPTKRSGF